MALDRSGLPAGLLLTGGTSARMGRDKATIVVGGETLAARVARALREAASPVLAAGHEAGTGLDTVDDPRTGPLAAVAAGREALLARGAGGPVLVLACDLPFADPALLRLLYERLVAGTADAVVPVSGGRDQPLCACYAPAALDRARSLAAAGARSMRELLDAVAVERLPEREWRPAADPRALLDADTPEDLAGLA